MDSLVWCGGTSGDATPCKVCRMAGVTLQNFVYEHATLPPGPPGVVRNVALSYGTASRMVLAWSPPADDGSGGSAYGGVNPTPSTIHPRSSTLNPQPSALDPEPSTLNPKPKTRGGAPPTRGCVPSHVSVAFLLVDYS
jgi:hypothetical protein